MGGGGGRQSSCEGGRAYSSFPSEKEGVSGSKYPQENQRARVQGGGGTQSFQKKSEKKSISSHRTLKGKGL